MTKIDLKREHHDCYAATGKCDLVDVPELAYLMIDGTGDPNTAEAYRDAVSALFSVAYKAKFAARDDTGVDHTVMPLEGLWWTDDMAEFSMDDKSNWFWTMLIAQPDHVTADHVADAIQHAVTAKHLDAARSIRLERWTEGRAAQILHIGPYAAEAPTIEKLHAFIAETSLSRSGKHHEIYLSDPARVAPERMRTIVRQPVR